jgi:hypothetical protein
VAGDHQKQLNKEAAKLVTELHSKIAEHLARDQHPELDHASGEAEELQAKQWEIRRRIKEMQAADPSKSFRQCWEKLQREEPQLDFEEP